MKPKIVFFGTPEFAAYTLRRLVEGGYDVAAVVTATDKPAGRGKKISMSAVKEYALEAGLPVMQPEKLKDPEFVGALESLHADLFVVIAFRMMPKVVWGMPRLGTFNLHASLLPDYRGAAPINWAVINGEKESGVTTFFISEEIDTGDIIDRQTVEIKPEDNAGDLHDRLMEIGAELTLKTVDALSRGGVNAISQQKLISEDRNPKEAPKIFKDTCRIDWGKDAESVRNHIRGMSPYPGAWTMLGETEFKVLSAKHSDKANMSAGEIFTDVRRLIVGCGSGSLELEIVQPQGKRRMEADAWLRGLREPLTGKFD